MAHHPTANGNTTNWTPYVRYCWVCCRPIGKTKLSHDYGPTHKYVDVHPRCHKKANKPGCEHRVPKLPGKP